MTPPIVAAMLYDPVECPDRSAMELFCDPAKRGEFSLIIRNKDEKKHDGGYRTKCVILEVYNAMEESVCTGRPYQTRLNPPPAGPPCCHPPWEAGQP